MKESRLIYFVLGVTTVVSLGAVTNQLAGLGGAGLALSDTGITFPDGTVQTTAASIDSRRSFYLRSSGLDGLLAPLGCASGYHMASLWEIFDVSNLRYATEQPFAERTDDSGEGPPAGPQSRGWIRTGEDEWDTSTTGVASCMAYTSNLQQHQGTVVHLANLWDKSLDAGGYILPWQGDVEPCNETWLVWCVED